MNTKVQSEGSTNSALSIRYKDHYFDLPEEVNEDSVSTSNFVPQINTENTDDPNRRRVDVMTFTWTQYQMVTITR